jgi:nitrogenase molybdenum-iron protein NifN
MGFPIFDRLGAAHRLFVGYRGAMETLFRLSNMMWSRDPENWPDSWYPESGGRSGDGSEDRVQEEFVPVHFDGHDAGSEGGKP